jgi:hypothetical protein
MNPKKAAHDVNIATDDAVKAAKLTHKAARAVAAAK